MLKYCKTPKSTHYNKVLLRLTGALSRGSSHHANADALAPRGEIVGDAPPAVAANAPPPLSPSARLNVNANLVAGATSGIVTTALLHPFDCVKTRFQVHEGVGKSLSVVPKYSSTLNAFRTILKHEGVRALYQGVPTAMIGSGTAWGMYFMLYEKAKAFVRWRDHEQRAGGVWSDHERNKKLPPWKHMLCGSAAGVCTVFVTNPIWLIKTRLQLQVMQPEKERLGLPRVITSVAAGKGRESAARIPKTEVYYRGFFDALRIIVRDEGPMALYKGLVPALLLVSHGAIHFTIYEELKSLSAQCREDGKMGRYDPLVLGGVQGSGIHTDLPIPNSQGPHATPSSRG